MKIILLIILSSMLLSCGVKKNELDNNLESRFVLVYHERKNLPSEITDIMILEDIITNKKYLIVDIGFGAGITEFKEDK